MKRFLILLVGLLFCVCSEMHAQIYNVTVKSKGEKKPLAGVTVYSFKFKQYAERADKDLGKGVKIEQDSHHYLEKKSTSPIGECNIQCVPEGYIVLDYQGYSGFYNIFETTKVDDDYRMQLFLDIGETMREVPVRGKMEKEVPEILPPIAHGDDHKIQYHEEIQALHAKDDARYVIYSKLVFPDYRGEVTFVDLPVVQKMEKFNGRDTVCVDTIVKRNVSVEVKDSVVNMPLIAVDGEEYEKTMERRMGFDKKHDKLHLYHFDSSTKLHNHQGEVIKHVQIVRFPEDTEYIVPGIIWYEDFNGVYFKESKLISDGLEAKPMRFLDSEHVRQINTIDRNTIYNSIEAVLQTSHESKAFPLQFEEASSRLNMRDSLTFAQRNQMMDWISAYDRQSVVQRIIIRGYSSPEGSEKTNRRLSKDRAKTIEDMLKANFSGYPIRSEFDLNDNIVPWEVVADTMQLMDDSLAHKYAVQLREIIKDVKGLEAQNAKIIRTTPTLYKYMKANVLHRVRKVYIDVEIVVQTILTKEEVVLKYNTDSLFRKTMRGYQYYVMLCHLADEKKWSELRELAKEAMERCPKTPVLRFVVDTLRLRERKTSSNLEEKTVPLISKEDYVTYPLASYYNAVATMQLGSIDTLVLKPYLDEGKVDHERLYQGKETPMNALPFIVAQALMYYQARKYWDALNLLNKYGLMNRPELKELVMFVRCQTGEYSKDETVLEFVKASSPLNEAVICTAMGQYKQALDILYSDRVDSLKGDVLYLRAICRFNENKVWSKKSTEYYSSNRVYNASVEGDDYHEGIDAQAFAYPMFEAFKLNEKYVEYLKRDGYFNNAYRQMMLYFWKRHKDGVPINRIAVEYNALVNQMRKEKDAKTSN